MALLFDQPPLDDFPIDDFFGFSNTGQNFWDAEEEKVQYLEFSTSTVYDTLLKRCLITLICDILLSFISHLQCISLKREISVFFDLLKKTIFLREPM